MQLSKNPARVAFMPTTQLNKLLRLPLLRTIGALTRYPLDCAKYPRQPQALVGYPDPTFLFFFTEGNEGNEEAAPFISRLILPASNQ
jgi:hypothetical protein